MERAREKQGMLCSIPPLYYTPLFPYLRRMATNGHGRSDTPCYKQPRGKCKCGPEASNWVTAATKYRRHVATHETLTLDPSYTISKGAYTLTER